MNEINFELVELGDSFLIQKKDWNKIKKYLKNLKIKVIEKKKQRVR